MFDFNKPKIEITEISDDKKYGRFVVEPLERGYGITLGNSLRRIMLSSLPGAAVSQVKIEGVLHEFSSIPGVKEDVTEIIMNLKSLAIRNNSETNEAKVAYIEFEGEGVVRASDIQVDQDIEIMNPDQVIATLNGGPESKLYMELTITKGRGYVSADKNKNPDLPIGVIAIDSIYTPVQKVNYTVEPTRVGQAVDYDKLTLEVWTDGTISARDAVSLGAKILCDHLVLFTDLSDTVGTRSTVVEKAETQRDKVLEMTGGYGADAVLECVGSKQSFDTAIGLIRRGGVIGRVGLPHDVEISAEGTFYGNIGIEGGPAPVRHYDIDGGLLDAVLKGEITPGRVFTAEYDLDHIQDAYEAMDQRKVIKALIRF